MNSFEALNEPVNLLEERMEHVALLWSEYIPTRKCLLKHGIEPAFFARHFGSRVIAYFIGVIRGNEQIGDCPVMNVMLDFFADRKIPLTDLYTVCSGLKNQILVLLLDEDKLTPALLTGLMAILDQNFVGVMEEYQERQQEKTLSKKPGIPQSPAVVPPTVFESVSDSAKKKTYEDILIETELQELSELEEEIDEFAVMISFGNIAEDSLEELARGLNRYGGILMRYEIFRDLGGNIIRLGENVGDNAVKLAEESMQKKISILFEGFVNDLTRWRKDLFEDGIEDPNKYDPSLIADIKTIQGILTGTQQEREEELELF